MAGITSRQIRNVACWGLFCLVLVSYAEVLAARPLIVGSDKAYPPYEFVNDQGEPDGFNVAVIRAVAEVMGLDIEIRTGTWNVIRRQVESGDIDMVSGMFYSKGRDEKVDFSTPHLTVSHAVFVRHDSGIQGLEDIRNTQIIVQKNDIGHDFVLENHLSNRIITTDQWTDTVELLARGAGDCAILSRLQTLVYTQTHKIRNLKVVGPPIKPKHYCFAVAEGRSLLLAQLNEGLSLIKSSGRYDRIYNHWFNKWEKQSFLDTYLIYGICILIAVAAVISLLLTWSWSLKRRIRLATEDLMRERDASLGIIKSAPTLIAVLGPDGRILSMNPSGQAILGAEEALILGRQWKGFLDRSGQEQSDGFWDQVFAGHRRLGNDLVSVRARGKRPRLLSCTSFARHDPGTDQIILFGEDITGLKQAEADLGESQRKLSTLINNLPGMAYRGFNDGERTMSFVSEGCRPLTGVARSELVFCYKQSYADLIHPKDRARVRALMDAAMARATPFQMEYRIITALGREKWVWEQGVAVVPDHGSGQVSIEGFITDISDRKLAEVRQQRLEDRLRQAHKMEAIGTLAGGIAHDFNNILGSIIGFGQILTLFRDPDFEQWEKRVNQMLTAAFRGRDLVRQILAFSRKSDGRRQPVLLRPLIREALNFLRASIPAGISIREKAMDRQTAVFADPSQMHQILMNLCSNAAHAMDGQGVLTVEAETLETDPKGIGPDDLPAGRYARIRVRDTGCGMAPDLVKRIFDPFFTTKPQGQGTGMGLSVVHGIVQDHGGTITVDSTPGQGSQFSVFLPVHNGDAVHQTAKAAHLGRGRGTVLFVDDEADLVEVAGDILGRLGYQVVEATDPHKALALFTRDPLGIDLVVTDHAMPGMSGTALAQKIRGIRQDIPVVLVTGMAHGMSMEKVCAQGISDVRVKPLDAPALAAIVKAYIKS